MVDHLSKRKHDKNQVHVVVLLEINKADGKLWDTCDNNRFYETFRMSRTTFYAILKKISNQIEKKMWQK